MSTRHGRLMSVEKPLLSASPGGRGPDETKTDSDGLAIPQLRCNVPLAVIGVQRESPVAWSHDGTKLCFVSGNKSLCLLSQVAGAAGPTAQEFKVDALLAGHTQPVKALTFSPKDSNLLISGGYEGIFIWDCSSGTVYKRLHESTCKDMHEGDVNCFEWGPDGTSLLSGGKDSDIKIWDALNDWALMETIVGHKSSVLAIAYNAPTARIASAGRDSTIKMWDGASLSPAMRARRADDSGIKCGLVHNMDGHRGDVVALTWMADGNALLSGARDNTMKLWDVRSAVVLRDVMDTGNAEGFHRGDVRKMIVLPGGAYMLSAGLDSTIKVWKLASTETIDRTVELTEEKRGEAEAALLASILGTGNDEAVAAAADEVDQLISTIVAFDTEGVMDLALNPRQPLLATSSSDNGVRLWKCADLANPSFMQEFRGHKSAVHECNIIDDSTLVTASDDYSIHVYSMGNASRPVQFPFNASVLCSAVRPASGTQRGYVIGGGADYKLKAFALDPVEYQAVTAHREDKPEPHEYVSAVFAGHAGRVNTVAVHPNGQMMASGGFDFSIMLWKLADEFPPCTPDRSPHAIPTFKPVAKVDAHKGHIMCLRFDPTNSLLASCSNDHSVKVWQVSKGMLGHKLKEKWVNHESHKSCVSAVSWGRGESAGTLFTSGWDRSINVFDAVPTVDRAGEAQPAAPALLGHLARITDTDVTAQGRFLVSVSVDVTAMLWNATRPFSPLVRYSMSSTDGWLSAVSAGLTRFVTASESGQISVWPLPGHESDALFTQFTKPATSGSMRIGRGSMSDVGPKAKAVLSLADASTEKTESGEGAGVGSIVEAATLEA